MPGVEAEPGLATVEETPQVMGALDHGPKVGMHRNGQAVPSADLLYRSKTLEQLIPGVVIDLEGLLITILTGRGSHNEHVSADSGEQLGLLLDRVKFRIAHVRAMQHDRHEPSYQAQAVLVQQTISPVRISRQEALGARLDRRQP